MTLQINLDRTNKQKLPDFIRLMYLLGMTVEIEGNHLKVTNREYR